MAYCGSAPAPRWRSPRPRCPAPGAMIRPRTPVWNRGAYLVATIGRCGECHTPRTWLGAPDPRSLSRRRPRPGPDGTQAPNITSDPKAGIGNWSADDIVTMLTDGTTPNFDEVGGSMAEIVKNTAKLSERIAGRSRSTCNPCRRCPGRSGSDRQTFRADVSVSGLDGSVATSYDACAPAPPAIERRRWARRGDGAEGSRHEIERRRRCPRDRPARLRGANLGARAIREELGPFRPDRAGSVRRRRPRRVSGRGIRRTRTFRRQAELDRRHRDRRDQCRDHRRQPAA